MSVSLQTGEELDFKDLHAVSQAWTEYHAPAYASARFFAPMDKNKCASAARTSANRQFRGNIRAFRADSLFA